MNKTIMKNLAGILLAALFFTACEKDQDDKPLKPSWVDDFSHVEIQQESFWNGSDGSGGFASGPLFFPNFYNEEWFSWSGFSVSNITDNQTPGWANQYSAITGGGFNESANYAVIYVSEFDETNHIRFTGDNMGKVFEKIYVTNTTYAALTMRDGDDFSKKFGGETGNDPDWFKLTIKGVKDGEIMENTQVEFYLADYRFEDNSKNYIVDTWESIDLAPLGELDEIRFFLSSSDLGEWGMNTPAYFCVGRIEVQ